MRRFAMMFIGAAVVVALAVGTSVYSTWLSAVDEAKAFTRDMTRVIVRHLDRDLATTAQGLSDIAAAWAADPIASGPELQRLVERTRRFNPLIDTVAVIDADGQFVASMPHVPSATQRDATDAPVLTRHREAHHARPILSAPFRRQPDATVLFALSLALRDAEGVLRAVVYAAIPVEEVLAGFGPLMTRRPTRLTLVSDEFRAIARLPPEGIGTDLSGSPVGRRVLAGERSGVIRSVSPIDGHELLVSFEASEKFGYFVVSGQTMPDVTARWLADQRATLIVCGLLLVCGIGFQVWMFRILRRRLQDEAALRAMAESRFHDAIGSMADGVAIWDRDDRLAGWNQRCAELFAETRDALKIGMPFAELVRIRHGRAAAGVGRDQIEESIRRRLARRGELGVSWEDEMPGGTTLEVVERRMSDGGIVGVYRDVTETRRVARERAESEARFRDGIESMAEGLVLYDRDDRLVAWNQRYLELMPYAVRAVRKGRSFREMLEDVIDEAMPHVGRAANQAWIESRIAARARFEGSIFETNEGRIIQATDRPTSDGGRVVVYRDATEERRLLERVSESERRFRDGIESMLEGFLLWDRDDRLLAWNRRAEALLPVMARGFATGVHFDAVLDHVVAATAHLPSASHWAAHAQHRRGRRERLSDRERFRTTDGRYIEVIEQPTSEGGIVSIYRDVTEITQAHEQLAATLRRVEVSEVEARRLACVAEHTHGGVLILDAQSRVGWCNPAFTVMTGYALEEILGLTPRQFLVAPWTSSEALARTAAAINAGRSIRIELAFRRKDMGEWWVDLDASPIFDADGRFVGVVGVHVDLTERKRQEAELQRALEAEREMNMQQRRFVSMASHEFRTPLAVIDGAAQRLVARLAPAEGSEISRRLDRIRTSVSRMTEMIDRTLSTARLDEGRITFEPGTLCLGRLVREICARQQTIVPSFTIVLTGEEDVAVEGDSGLLDQVFTNLVSNAVKYSGAARRIEIDIASTEGGVEVSVRDYGVGIPADEIGRLFTRFYRATTALKLPGTGIGLHLVKELVALHGGAVRVSSEVGAGSRFAVWLPLRQVDRDRGGSSADVPIAAGRGAA
jgi:PAS domain S-box-containing protein